MADHVPSEPRVKSRAPAGGVDTLVSTRAPAQQPLVTAAAISFWAAGLKRIWRTRKWLRWLSMRFRLSPHSRFIPALRLCEPVTYEIFGMTFQTVLR